MIAKMDDEFFRMVGAGEFEMWASVLCDEIENDLFEVSGNWWKMDKYEELPEWFDWYIELFLRKSFGFFNT